MDFSEFDFRWRIGVPASVAGVAIGILFAIFEVQGWKVPTPLAIFFLAVVSAIIIAALGMVVWELVKEALRFREYLVTTPSWVLPDEPGLMDYEPDSLRAIGRFNGELQGLGRDTRRVGQAIGRHTVRLQEAAASGNAKLKQRRANQAAKAMDRSANYISKRAALMKALVKDIYRNMAGLIATAGITTEGDRAAAQTLLANLDANQDIVATSIDQVVEYRGSVQSTEDANLARTLRKASERLGESLEDTVRILRDYRQKSRQLHAQLRRRLES